MKALGQFRDNAFILLMTFKSSVLAFLTREGEFASSALTLTSSGPNMSALGATFHLYLF